MGLEAVTSLPRLRCLTSAFYTVAFDCACHVVSHYIDVVSGRCQCSDVTSDCSLQISLLICVAGRGSCVGCRDCCGRLQTNGVVTALTRSDDQSAVARSWFSSVLMSTSFLLCWFWSFIDGYCGYTTTVFNADFAAWASPGVPWFRLVLLTVAVRWLTHCLLDGIGICCLFDVTGILGSGPIPYDFTN